MSFGTNFRSGVVTVYIALHKSYILQDGSTNTQSTIKYNKRRHLLLLMKYL